MSRTNIEWADEVWNPIRGCSRVSEGCRHCYAETMAGRIVRMGKGKPTPYDGLVRMIDGEARWTGEVAFDVARLADPLRWKKPRRIFVNSMSDLFHESLTNEQIAAVFGVMAACPQHTFMVLTKRAKRMREWFAWMASGDISPCGKYAAASATVVDFARWYVNCPHMWPLPNVWLGVSVENQEAADERIPELLETPAAVRFLSCEPLLGTIQFKPFTIGAGTYCFDCRGAGVKIDEDGCCITCGADAAWFGIDWVIAGCESGPGARPCDVEWLRSLRDQCRAAGVPYFLKQATAWNKGRDVVVSMGIGCGPESHVKPDGIIGAPYLDGKQHLEFPVRE